MATEDQFNAARRASGVTGAGTARVRCSRSIDITIAGHAAAVKDSTITLPAGSWLRAVTLETPTAISGSPSSVNFRAGTTDTGQQIVADVDAKAQGHITGTVVAGFEKKLAVDTQLFLQATSAGGTAEAGVITVFVDYDAPVF